MWGAYAGEVKGTLVKGDENVPATRWWNHLYLLFWGWKTVAVLQMEEPYAGFYIGYRDFLGTCKMSDQMLKGQRVRVRVGKEDCIFFAVNALGDEVALTEVIRTTKDDPDYREVPLI